MVEKALEDLANDEFASLYGFGLMAIKPALSKGFLLSDLEGVLVVSLHFSHQRYDGGETQVKQLLHIEVAHFDHVLSVLGEGCRPYFLRPKYRYTH